MNDERKPKQDPTGHATIPPGLRPFLGATAQAEEHPHHRDLVMDAAFAKIIDAIGDDVQEIDPDVGVGNVSQYVGPALVPDGTTGKAFTAKVKIVERQANDGAGRAEEEEEERTVEKAPPSSRGGFRLGGRTARLMARAAAVEHAPPVSVAEEKESTSPREGRSRGRAIVVAIGALGVVVAVAVWIAAKGPREGGNTAGPAVSSGAATVAPSAPAAVRSSGEVVAAPAPKAPPIGTAEVDAGASLAPSGPTGVVAAPYKPKGGAVKREDPYDAAAPLPAKTVEAVVAPPPAPIAPVISAMPSILPAPTVVPSAKPGLVGGDKGVF